jgi:hypothetical protein
MACSVLSAGNSRGRRERIGNGLVKIEYRAPIRSAAGDNKITSLRFDTSYYAFDVYCAVDYDSTPKTVSQWSRKLGLVAATNAGMYGKDYLSHIGYLKHKGSVRNSYFRDDYKTVFVCNPAVRGIPSVRLVDLQCIDFKVLMRQYNTVMQNIRMISCDGRNVWGQQSRQWSIAALATDSAGAIFLLFSQSPYSVHDFIDMIQRLMPSIVCAMYLEGGAPAALYCQTEKMTVALSGYKNIGERDYIRLDQPMPNIIGIRKK